MPETDSIPRIRLEDLFLVLRDFKRDPVRRLEDLRLKICAHRQKSPAGDRSWSTARDTAIELQRLGLVDAGSFPKDRRSYEQLRENKLRLTQQGRDLIDQFENDRAGAYDETFRRMYTVHPYLQAFVQALQRGTIRAPVLTSFKEHVSAHYASAQLLTEDVSRNSFDMDALLGLLEQRLTRALTSPEQASIREGINRLLEEWSGTASTEDASGFAKKFLQKLNDVILATVLRADGLGFDFKTHQTLWGFGEAWKLWQSTARHPDWDLRLVFRTATIRLAPGLQTVADLVFDTGLAATRRNFLEKLYAAYQELQQKGRRTFVIVDELRSVFCYAHHCQESVFDRLVSEHYEGSDEYELNMEIFRKSGQHDRPIRIGRRNIGLLRITKRQQAYA